MGLRRSFASYRGLVLVGLVAILLAVVAWAATGVGGGDATAPSGRSHPGLNGALESVVAAAWGAAIVVVIVTVRKLRRRLDEDAMAVDPQAAPRPWWVSPVAWLIVVAVVLIPILFFADRRAQEPQATPEPGSSGTAIDAEDRRTPSPWVVAGFAVGAAVAALSLAVRRRAPVVDDREPLPELLVAVVDVVDDSIRDIESDSDARRAIIRAYARMEGALARGGVPRRPSETPFEYLESALGRLMVPAEPVRSLTELFEVAKFSDRPVDASMKRRAIDCLLDVRSALTAEVT
jgi:hypothetical protein